MTWSAVVDWAEHEAPPPPPGPSPLLAGMFDKQREFCDAEGKRKALLCGRRGGKTETMFRLLAMLLEQFPGETLPYIARTQKSARRIIWPVIRRAIKTYDLPLELHESTLEVRHENGAKIWVTGCDNHGNADDVRGLRYPAAVIDECQAFPSDLLKYLVEECLEPALMDFDGLLVMGGTPGLELGSYWHQVTEPGELGVAVERVTEAWPTSHWTCLDNPYVKGAEYIEGLKVRRKWADDHPTLQREYWARWVVDKSAIIYSFVPRRNGFLELDGKVIVDGEVIPERPKPFWVLSVDVGFDDATALVLSRSNRGFPDVWVEKAWELHNPSVSRIVAEVVRTKTEMKGKPLKIVLDPGGGGRLVRAEFEKEVGVETSNAKKSDKKGGIEVVRGMLGSGTMHVHTYAGRPLAECWRTLPWNEDRTDHDESHPDDLADSMIYGVKEHSAAYRPHEVPPEEGSPEWHKQQTDEKKTSVLKKNRDRMMEKLKSRYGGRR